jgi:hypothetical protein
MKLLIRGAGVNVRSEPNGRIVRVIGRGGEVASRVRQENGWTEYHQDGIFFGWIRDDVVTTIQPPEVRHDVEWISQLGAGADKWGGDCGAACIVMLLHAYFGIRPSVDEVAAHFGFSVNKRYGTITDIVRTSGLYGLPMVATTNADIYHTAKTLETRPFIQLFDYQLLSSRYDPMYRGGHYAVVVRCDADTVTLLDPYDRNLRLHRLSWRKWRDIVGVSSHNLPTQAIVPAQPLVVSIRDRLTRLKSKTETVIDRL